uniref:Uncharacterized protein n=1 Tax=Plectus sambesii TaxID=2011161 RepID=A0A914VJR8_9BILA
MYMAGGEKQEPSAAGPVDKLCTNQTQVPTTTIVAGRSSAAAAVDSSARESGMGCPLQVRGGWAIHPISPPPSPRRMQMTYHNNHHADLPWHPNGRSSTRRQKRDEKKKRKSEWSKGGDRRVRKARQTGGRITRQTVGVTERADGGWGEKMSGKRGRRLLAARGQQQAKGGFDGGEMSRPMGSTASTAVDRYFHNSSSPRTLMRYKGDGARELIAKTEQGRAERGEGKGDRQRQPAATCTAPNEQGSTTRLSTGSRRRTALLTRSKRRRSRKRANDPVCPFTADLSPQLMHSLPSTRRRPSRRVCEKKGGVGMGGEGVEAADGEREGMDARRDGGRRRARGRQEGKDRGEEGWETRRRTTHRLAVAAACAGQH